MADGASSFPASAQAAAEVVWSSDQGSGIGRRRAGKGFAYRDAEGALVRETATLERIRRLAIPPAWTGVWINPDPCGHLQASGRDAKGRKQYRYHDGFSAQRAGAKYARTAAFGRALPRIRAQVEQDLNRRGMPREKVLATVVRLLELTLVRVGNREYARQNRSYGLTTLTKRHLDLHGAALRFHFKGKSGVEHDVGLRDRRLASILKAFQHLPGQHLFKYRDEAGRLVPIGSHDVNAYLRRIAGEDFSAKDFRTWAATVSAARVLCCEPAPDTPTAARRGVAACCKAVSTLLGNTPSVCRSSYIHPKVLKAFGEGRLTGAFPAPEHADFEAALIAFLETESMSAA